MNPVRCAIYTRKSSDEGLEQDFNSLDAQREACAAYILSQASEGWTQVPDRYDDGGLSGGTLQRPALQQLLADVAAGKVDIIVVYKVDRLTRSLLDFAKLVEAFDRSNTSFVSVTQSFNTTTSMGRLTLNMLLSFAQFEREVTAERIRDKLAASKAKGMWMGGIPPLGYKPDGRSLAIVEDHATLVRDIYVRYLKLGKIRLVAEQLAGEGIKSPERTTKAGLTYGSRNFSRGQISAILRNPIYRGLIAHKGKLYPGKHLPIIDEPLWQAVQARLEANVVGQRQKRSASASLLAGKLVDAQGQPLIAVHTRKGTRRYRYYVSRDRHHLESKEPALRLPAREIEQLIVGNLIKLIESPFDLAARLGVKLTPAIITALQRGCSRLTQQLPAKTASIVPELIEQVRVMSGALHLSLVTERLVDLLGLPPQFDVPKSLTHTIPVQRSFTGKAVRLIDERGCAATTDSVESLTNLIIRARQWWALLAKGDISIKQLAPLEGVSESYITRVARLAFLSPKLVEAILDGRQKAGVDAKMLTSTGAISLSWAEQEAAYLGAANG